MRLYTAHFNRLIGEQFVLQYKHVLEGFRFETPPGSNVYVKPSIVSLVYPKPNKTAFPQKSGGQKHFIFSIAQVCFLRDAAARPRQEWRLTLKRKGSSSSSVAGQLNIPVFTQDERQTELKEQDPEQDPVLHRSW